ncbi:subtilase family protein [Algoriphagus ratkowskyi]|nr:S8 family serine peptidase [Algoriphagus ratkowskyi]PZX55341.1 subtilase family protein [Algoriphagus ratkowskyi]
MKTNKNRLSHLVVITILLFAGCDSNMVQVDEPIDAQALEEQTNSSNFNLSELIEITDFTNLRQGDYTGRFLIISKSQNLPNNLASIIKKAGGEIVKTYPEIGVAVAVSRSSNFYANAKALKEIESITADIILQYTKNPEGRTNKSNLETTTIGVPFNYQSAFFDGFQWAPTSIEAPAAWDAGYTGDGVRVAVIDGGFHSTHVDLAPNFDITSSISTYPGYLFNEDVGTFWHGTHVAGIVAAAGVGIVGIAPEATLIGIKSLHNGSGAFEFVLDGILYAAKPQSQGGAGAQIINMSLGATFDYRNNWGDKDFRDYFREMQKIFDRATRYAYQNGVTVFAAAGNGGNNYDVANELYQLPAENQHVLSISSTGPTGWVLGNTNFSQPAYYTDHGKSLVDFAAPGGTIGLYIIEGYDDICTLNGTFANHTNFCETYDMVFSSIKGFGGDGWYGWAQGTSMASPAAAGVAALIIQANGGKMSPAQVKTKMLQSATDLGKPGQDEFYGNGFVNAAKAVGIN